MVTLTRCARCGADKIGEAGLCLTCETAPDDAPPPPDALLDRVRAATRGEYEVVREIGRGTITAVYLARDLGLDVEVAIKVLLPEQAARRGTASRVLRAVGRAAALGAHPNVVRVYRAPLLDGLRVVVMQHVDGTTLTRVLRLAPRLSCGLACHVLAQTARALQHAHERGVVHGDVEPGNVMLDRSGSVVLTDFGIASAARRKHAPTAADDQRALGALAYEMLAGVSPFAEQPTAPLRALRPDCPAALEALVQRMLAPSPAERWPDLAVVCEMLAEVEPEIARLSAAELVARLGRLATSATPHVVSASPPHAPRALPAFTAAPRPRRWPRAVAGVGVLAAAAVGIVAVGSVETETPAADAAALAALTPRAATPAAPPRLAVAPWRGDSLRDSVGGSLRVDSAAGRVDSLPAAAAAPEKKVAPRRPAPARVVIMTRHAGQLIAQGDSVLLHARVTDRARRTLREVDVSWSSSDPTRLTLHRTPAGVWAIARWQPGVAKVTARAGRAAGGFYFRVESDAAVDSTALREDVAARPD